MRKDIDYSNYDPANFSKDHPDDPAVLNAEREAENLSTKIVRQGPSGDPVEQERNIAQDFYHLETDITDKQEQADKIEQLQHKNEFSQGKTDAIYRSAIDRLEMTPRPPGQLAAWQGVKKDVDDARASVATDPEYLKQRDQLTHFQAARNEAIGLEVNHVAEKTIDEVSRQPSRDGEATDDTSSGKPGTADQLHSTSDEDKARIQRAQEAQKLATSPPGVESSRGREFGAER